MYARDLIETLGTRKKRGRLSLGFLFAATDATDAPLDCVAHVPASGVAATNASGLGLGGDDGNDTGSFVVACAAGTVVGGHLGTSVAVTLVVLESLFDRVRWLALAFEVVRVVLL